MPRPFPTFSPFQIFERIASRVDRTRVLCQPAILYSTTLLGRKVCPIEALVCKIWFVKSPFVFSFLISLGVVVGGVSGDGPRPTFSSFPP